METLLEMDLLLAGTFFLAFFLEIWRFQCLYPLKLNLTWPGGWRYAYYLPFLAILAGIGPTCTTELTYLLTLLWRFCMALPLPGAIYASSLFLIILAGIVAFLLYRALIKVKPLREMILPMGSLTLIAVLCFVVEPLRWIFGGTLVVLVTSALGDLVRFTGWHDLAQWLNRPEEAGANGKRDSVRVLLFLEATGVLRRRGEQIEVLGEQMVEVEGDPAAALASRLLDRSRLAEIATAIEETKKRNDILKEIALLIAKNLISLCGYRESIFHEKGPAQKKEEKVVEKVQQVLDAGLGEQLRSLLYWHYDMPQESVRLAVCRVPRMELKPLLTFREYLGLFLSRYARRRKRCSAP